MDEDVLLTKKDVMRYLHCSHDTLSRLMKQGAIAYIKFEKTRRGKVLFRKRDIEHFLESKTVRSKLNK